MKIIFIIRTTDDGTFCFQEPHAEEYNRILDFEMYCEKFGFSYTKRLLGFLGIYIYGEQYARPEYSPYTTRRLEHKLNWKELYT
jgi:hypothetical protein